MSRFTQKLSTHIEYLKVAFKHQPVWMSLLTLPIAVNLIALILNIGERNWGTAMTNVFVLVVFYFIIFRLFLNEAYKKAMGKSTSH